MVSIICPVYNESKFIEKVLDFCVNAKPLDKEIIFIDGGSKDDTCDIIRRWIEKYPQIKLLHNARKIVPFALNLAIQEAKGDSIIRIDAHTDYALDYFEKILETFEKTGADIVGGPTRTSFLDKTQEAVAYAICTSFAIGNSRVHQEDYEGFTDSVTFGSWKKSIFSKTGLFDESLKRNQDDEFHYRARSLGFTIYQSPDIKLYYYPRNTLKGLYKQYFEYGLYKPLVLKKVKSGTSWRHLIPSAFVLYVFSLFIAIALKLYFWFVFLGLYILTDIAVCIKSGKSFPVMLRLFLVYPTIHFAYGIGFIQGLFKKNKK